MGRNHEHVDQCGCPECYRKPQVVHAFYPDDGEESAPSPVCPSCGRSLGVVIRVVYEGEGVLANE
jgi:hypothetical protein